MIAMTASGEDEGIKSYKTELSVKVKCEYFLVNWIKQNKTFEELCLALVIADQTLFF